MPLIPWRSGNYSMCQRFGHAIQGRDRTVIEDFDFILEKYFYFTIHVTVQCTMGLAGTVWILVRFFLSHAQKCL